VPVEVDAGEDVTGISYRDRELRRPVTGRLLDPSGKPAPFVSVNAEPASGASSPTAFAQTGEDGTFVMPTLPGSYRIVFGDGVDRSDYQYQWYPRSATAGGGATVTVLASDDEVSLGTVTATPYPTVSGVSPTGPVIRSRSPSPWGTRTDSWRATISTATRTAPTGSRARATVPTCWRSTTASRAMRSSTGTWT
jgi:hypothetical protein